MNQMKQIVKFPTLLAAHQADVRGPPVGPQVENRCPILFSSSYSDWPAPPAGTGVLRCRDLYPGSQPPAAPIVYPFPSSFDSNPGQIIGLQAIYTEQQSKAHELTYAEQEIRKLKFMMHSIKPELN